MSIELTTASDYVLGDIRSSLGVPHGAPVGTSTIKPTLDTQNIVDSQYTSILNGSNNSALSSYSTVLNGDNNIADGLFSFIAGGSANDVNQQQNVFILGSDIIASSPNTTYVNNLVSTGSVSGQFYGDGSFLSNVGLSSFQLFGTKNQVSTTTTGLSTTIYFPASVVLPGSIQATGAVVDGTGTFSQLNAETFTVKSSSAQSGFARIQNLYTGASASSDLAIYNDIGDTYLDIGIAGSQYNGNLYNPTFNITNANDSYVYNTYGNLVIGTANNTAGASDVVFFTGGSLSGVAASGGNERMRISNAGRVSINVPSANHHLTVGGSISATNAVYADRTLVNNLSSRYINLIHTIPNDGINPVFFIGEAGDGVTGGTTLGSLTGFNITYDEINNKLNTYTQFDGLTSNVTTIDSAGNFGIGTTSPNNKLTVIGGVSATGDLNVGGNFTVGGTFTVAGTATYINTTNLVVSDSLIYVADGNAANLNDIGIVGHFTDQTNSRYQHTGLVRQSNQSSPGAWTLFSGVTSEPLSSSTVGGIGVDPTYTLDSLKVYDLSASSNVWTNKIRQITPNSSIAVESLSSGPGGSVWLTALSAANGKTALDPTGKGILIGNTGSSTANIGDVIVRGSNSVNIDTTVGGTNIKVATAGFAATTIGSSSRACILSGGPISLNNNGTTGVNVDTSGNVGIGTQSPNTKIHMVSGTNNLQLDPNWANSGNSYLFSTGSGGLLVGTSDAKPLTLYTSNVGRLSINGTSTTNAQITVGNTDSLTVQPSGVNTNSNIFLDCTLNPNGTGRKYAIYQDSSNGSFNIYDSTGSATRLSISNTGVIGANGNPIQNVSYISLSGGTNTVTQQNSKSTPVTLNAPMGSIVTHGASLNSSAVALFSFNNNFITSLNDTVFVQAVAATGGYNSPTGYTVTANVTAVGIAAVSIRNNTPSAQNDSITLKYFVLRSAS